MMKYLFFSWSDFYKYFVKIKNGISVSFTLNMISLVTVLIEIWQAKDHRNPVFSYSKISDSAIRNFGQNEIRCFYHSRSALIKSVNRKTDIV